MGCDAYERFGIATIMILSALTEFINQDIHGFTRQSSEPTTKYSPPAEEKLRLSTTQKSLHSVELISRRRGNWSEKFHVQKLSRETRYLITFVTRAPF